MNKTGFAAAPFSKRLMAFIIDMLIAGIVAFFCIANVQIIADQGVLNEMVAEIEIINTDYNLKTFTVEEGYKSRIIYTDSEGKIFAEILAGEQSLNRTEDPETDLNIARKYCLDNSKSCVVSEAEIEQYRSRVAPIESTISLVVVLVIAIGCFISGLLFSVIIPLLLKDGRSIGRKMLGLGLRTTKGQTVKFFHLLARLVSAVIIEILLGIIFTGITLLASGLLVLFTYNSIRCNIHDFLSSTVVVDLNSPIEPVARLDVV